MRRLLVPAVPVHGAVTVPADASALMRLAGQWDVDLFTIHQAPTTRGLYQQVLRLFDAWLTERGIQDPAHITRPIIEAYQRHLARARPASRTGPAPPLSVRTQYVRLKVLVTFFRWAVRKGHLTANPAADLDFPRLPSRLPQFLTPDDVVRLLAQPDLSDPVGIRDRAILELLWSTGLRRSEVIALTADAIDATRGLLRVTAGKGEKDRLVPIGTRALEWLGRYQEEARPRLAADAGLAASDLPGLWLRPGGGPLTANALTSRVKGYLRSAGLHHRGSCHLLRHAMASGLLDNGCDVRLIQTMLGHAKLETTAIYTHVAIRHLVNAHKAFHPAEAGAVSPSLPGNPPEHPGP